MARFIYRCKRCGANSYGVAWCPGCGMRTDTGDASDVERACAVSDIEEVGEIGRAPWPFDDTAYTCSRCGELFKVPSRTYVLYCPECGAAHRTAARLMFLFHGIAEANRFKRGEPDLSSTVLKNMDDPDIADITTRSDEEWGKYGL